MTELLLPCVEDRRQPCQDAVLSAKPYAVVSYRKAGFRLIHGGEKGRLLMKNDDMPHFSAAAKQPLKEHRTAAASHPGTNLTAIILYYTPSIYCGGHMCAENTPRRRITALPCKKSSRQWRAIAAENAADDCRLRLCARTP